MDEKIYITIITTITLVLMAVLVINLLLIARNKRTKHRSEMHDAKLAFERELISSRLEITESTLNEVSADLHDEVGQMLAVAILELNRLEGSEDAKAAVKTGLDSLRTISKSLNPEFLKSIGLKEAIFRLAERIKKQGIIKVIVLWNENVGWDNLNNEVYVFRILQELTTNTLKYASAKLITIQIEREKDAHVIRYSDDGIGFGGAFEKGLTGLGMINIYRRVQVLNGTIIIETKPGLGFIAVIRLPDSRTIAKFGD